jgi:hypothetical protein
MIVGMRCAYPNLQWKAVRRLVVSVANPNTSYGI